MRIGRRGFFGILAAATVGAVSKPLSALFSAPVAVPMPLMFKGVPIVFDENMSAGTIGGINSATYSFWRNRQAAQHTAFDDISTTMKAAMN